jgi:hypothetical protein
VDTLLVGRAELTITEHPGEAAPDLDTATE